MFEMYSLSLLWFLCVFDMYIHPMFSYVFSYFFLVPFLKKLILVEGV